jgi:hypothetical protein
MWLRIAAVWLVLSSGILEPFPSEVIAEIKAFFTSVDRQYRGLIAGIIGALLTGAIAWIALRTNAAVNIRNKRVDVIMHCNMRYDDLYKLRMEIEDLRRSRDVKTADYEAFRTDRIKSYFRRYWGLKSDQLDYWLAGYVDPETLSSWFMSTADALAENGPMIGGVGYREHLVEMQTSHKIVNQRLIEMVDFLIDYIGYIAEKSEKYAAILHYIRLVENEETALIAKLARNDHNRLRASEFSRTLRDDYLEKYEKYAPSGLILRLRRLALAAYRRARTLRLSITTLLLGDTIGIFKTALRDQYATVNAHLCDKEGKEMQRQQAIVATAVPFGPSLAGIAPPPSN